MNQAQNALQNLPIQRWLNCTHSQTIYRFYTFIDQVLQGVCPLEPQNIAPLWKYKITSEIESKLSKNPLSYSHLFPRVLEVIRRLGLNVMLGSHPRFEFITSGTDTQWLAWPDPNLIAHIRKNRENRYHLLPKIIETGDAPQVMAAVNRIANIEAHFPNLVRDLMNPPHKFAPRLRDDGQPDERYRLITPDDPVALAYKLCQQDILDTLFAHAHGPQFDYDATEVGKTYDANNRIRSVFTTVLSTGNGVFLLDLDTRIRNQNNWAQPANTDEGRIAAFYDRIETEHLTETIQLMHLKNLNYLLALPRADAWANFLIDTISRTHSIVLMHIFQTTLGQQNGNLIPNNIENLIQHVGIDLAVPANGNAINAVPNNQIYRVGGELNRARLFPRAKVPFNIIWQTHPVRRVTTYPTYPQYSTKEYAFLHYISPQINNELRTRLTLGLLRAYDAHTPEQMALLKRIAPDPINFDIFNAAWRHAGAMNAVDNQGVHTLSPWRDPVKTLYELSQTDPQNGVDPAILTHIVGQYGGQDDVDHEQRFKYDLEVILVTQRFDITQEHPDVYDAELAVYQRFVNNPILTTPEDQMSATFNIGGIQLPAIVNNLNQLDLDHQGFNGIPNSVRQRIAAMRQIPVNQPQ